jgi:hypothetical protein
MTRIRYQLIAVVPTAEGSHCVATAPNRTAFDCDPKKDRLLVFRDPLPIHPVY